MPEPCDCVFAGVAFTVFTETNCIKFIKGIEFFKNMLYNKYV